MQYSTPHTLLETYAQLSRDNLIPATSASALFGITNDYVTRLCRQKKIHGVLLGRLWFVSEKSLKEYLAETRFRRELQHRMLSQQLSQEYQQRTLAAKPI